MTPLAPGLFTVQAPQRFLGLEMGARMTVIQTSQGLWVHSPIACDPASLGELGEPRWVVAPNLFHHLHIGPWIERGGEGWCCPGLQAKRPDLRFAGTLQQTGQPFGEDILSIPLRCFPLSQEVVFLHRPSRSLILTDLVFNIQAHAPFATRAAMFALWGYPGCSTTLLERVAMHRDLARQELGALLELDFDRLILAHGAVVETGGKRALTQAFSWLW
ncbi:MAG: hypothetical protein VX899_22115 [Myxococcota bacterium]|nr:hypothetical protein [Myxococcota bacterium]